MRYILLGLLMGSSLFSASLVFTKGDVVAHTSVFGDNQINPHSSSIISHLTMNHHDVTSLKGSVNVSLTQLKSDNAKRDEHMYEALNTAHYPQTIYTITSVKPSNNGSYTIQGNLNLYGTTKPVNLTAILTEKNNQLTLKAKTSFKMSDFGIKPPKMFFLTVRDQVDMKIDTTYTEK